MRRPVADRVVGWLLVTVGALLCSLLILAAFTFIGVISLPVGLALIVWGALRLRRDSA